VVPATVLGVVCAALASVVAPLAVPVAWLAVAPTAVIVVVARTFASIPAAGVRWPGGVPTDLALWAVVAVVVIIRGRRRRSTNDHAILGRWPP
jgi:hypothetical protein